MTKKSRLLKFLQILGYIGLFAAILAMVMPAINAVLIFLKSYF